MFERNIHFEACFNFRDLGGYETTDGRKMRWRRLFRSGEVHLMTDTDAALAIGQLGIKTIIDLREPKVVADEGSGPLAVESVRFKNIPWFDDWDDLFGPTYGNPLSQPEEYLRQLDSPVVHDRVRKIFTTMVESLHDPLLFHCSAGKDRTGLVAALLLGAFGCIGSERRGHCPRLQPE